MQYGSRAVEKGGIMGGWEIFAWLAVALVTVLRVALVVGIVALVVAIVRGVRAYQPASRAS